MSWRDAPLVEPRSESDVATDLAQRARIAMDGSDPMGEGLVRVFARYFGIVADRLNRVPGKHHQAFLSVLGTRPTLPTAARVPLTFEPIKQLAQRTAAGDRPYVPMHTRVAAEATDGGDPIVFETDRPLDLVGAVIDRVVVLDVMGDRVADVSDLAVKASPPVRLFIDRMRPARHDLFVERPSQWPPETRGITVHFVIDTGDAQARDIVWSLAGDAVDRTRDRRLVPELDTTSALTVSGKLRFSGLSEWPVCRIAGRDGRFLRAHVTSVPMPTDDRGRGARPKIRRVAMSGRFQVDGEAPQAATYNAQPVDLTTGFHPLGLAPRFGDAFYLLSRLFAIDEADIAVRIDLVQATADDATPVTPPHTRLVWECVRDGHWASLACDDTTHGLTRSGALYFRTPPGGSVVAVGGVAGGWIRARLAKADVAVGQPDERIVVDPTSPAAPPAPVHRIAFVPAIERVTIDAARAFPRVPIDAIVVADDFETVVRPVSSATPVDPFARRKHDRTGLYLRLAGDVAALEDRTLAIHAVVDEGRTAAIASGTAATRTHALAAGELWTGDTWTKTALVDESEGLSRAGSILLGIRPRPVGAPSRPTTHAWVRLRWTSDASPSLALVERLLLNTVSATQATTYEDELLGSSNGAARQVFHCARTPVLEDIEVDVREPDVRGADAQGAPTSARPIQGTADRVFKIAGVEAKPATWVRWIRVDDFVHSGPEDRHFVLDPLTGSILFGDGSNGHVPPAGANNVRAHRYRSGGGARGNVAAHAIVALRTTVPSVTAVANPVAATGGGDVEPMDRCIARGGAWLRHRDRAVTREDFEDLALAVPQIARARCLPLHAIDRDPQGERLHAGCVTVLVVPHEGETRPVATASQLRVVQAFLDARRPPAVRLTVAAVPYVAIDIDATLACDATEDPVVIANRCSARLADFLHPLTGGRLQRGWRFAELPTSLVLDALLRRVEGVSQVDALQLALREDQPGLAKRGHFLVCSGTHRVRCAVREAAEDARPA